MRRLTRTTAVAALVVFGSAPGRAQDGRGNDPGCVLDKCLGQKPPGRAARPEPTAPEPSSDDTSAPEPSFRSGRPGGNFDFYVLALSWSPSFCATDGASRARNQCASGANLGFVVHGLWPQFERGYPRNCDAASRSPSRIALDAVRGVYPDEGLARHEWQMHGTCSGKSPTDYFADVRRARDAITIPEPFKAPTSAQSWAPLDIARAFIAANPRLRTDSMGVTCRQNSLQEVRICFGKDLRGFVPCPEVARASCRRPVDVPPVR